MSRELPGGTEGAKELASRLARAPAGDLHAMGQGLGFGLHMQQAVELLPLIAEDLPRSQERERLLQGIATGLGRGQPVRAVLDLPPGYCGEQLPPTLRGALARGLGLGMSCRLGGKVPAWIPLRLCPALRKSFARGTASNPWRCIRFTTATALQTEGATRPQ